MEFRILGPMEVVGDGGPLPLGGAKQRALLAVLVLNANRVVSTGRLIEDLWGDDSPPTAGHMLPVYVSRLRKTIQPAGAQAGEAILETRAPGYVLRIPLESIDARRFEALVSDGRRAMTAGDASLCAAKLNEALSLWRGPPLADL